MIYQQNIFPVNYTEWNTIYPLYVSNVRTKSFHLSAKKRISSGTPKNNSPTPGNPLMGLLFIFLGMSASPYDSALLFSSLRISLLRSFPTLLLGSMSRNSMYWGIL